MTASRIRQLLLVVVLCAGLPAAPAAEQPRLAIIIDDLGYGLAQGQRVINLPGPIACAILPATPRAAQLAELAHRNGKEVLLHLPLQSVGDAVAPEPGGIGIDTSRTRFMAILASHLAAIPFVSGINNHMGSLITRHPGHMQWLMEEISRQDDLFFVDSYTTERSVAMQVAAEFGVASVRRDVFLDPDRQPQTIHREFERVLKLARAHGSALAIGHPYPTTLEFLERKLPDLADAGIELVSLQKLIDGRAMRSPAVISLARSRHEAYE